MELLTIFATGVVFGVLVSAFFVLVVMGVISFKDRDRF